MKSSAWKAFVAAREHYRDMVEQLRRELPNLGLLQQELVHRRVGPAYTVETPVVYNEALDSLGSKDEIKLILVADNPGRREQAAENRRYLVGPSGKIAERFFREEPALGIDFRKNVLILNKTPVHTPRTAELRELCRLGGPMLTETLAGSQRAMVRLLEEFYRALAPVPVWIIGYSEMKRGGIFEVYTDALGELVRRSAAKPQRAKKAPDASSGKPAMVDQLYFYRHFSMNQFTIDLHKQTRPEETTTQTLERIGKAYRERILGNITVRVPGYLT